jgi:allophanate hydrolase subunit 1
VVYVDDMEAPFGRMIMCHMMADTTKELFEMAHKIRVQRKWIQKPGTVYEHFDICQSKRKLAVRFGAKEISQKDLAKIIRGRHRGRISR